jgi:hypothetical protein
MSGSSKVLETICDKYSCKPIDNLEECYAEKSINPPSVELSGTLEADFKKYPEDTWKSTTCASLKSSRVTEVQSMIAAKKVEHAQQVTLHKETENNIKAIARRHTEVVKQLAIPDAQMAELEMAELKGAEQKRVENDRKLDSDMSIIMKEYDVVSGTYLQKKSEAVYKYLQATNATELKQAFDTIKQQDKEFLTQLEQYKVFRIKYNDAKADSIQQYEQHISKAQELQSLSISPALRSQLQQAKGSLEELHAQHTKKLGVLKGKIDGIAKEHDYLVGVVKRPVLPSSIGLGDLGGEAAAKQEEEELGEVDMVKGSMGPSLGGKKKRRRSRKKHSKKNKDMKKKTKKRRRSRKKHSKKNKDMKKKTKKHKRKSKK